MPATELSYSQHQTLVKGLCSQLHHENDELIETHISSVILSGDRVYKIKKPVDFGFLNFTTLELRKHYCEEELRLNKRLAAELYLDIVPIQGSIGQPTLGGKGVIIDYAIKMKRFSQHTLLDRQLNDGHVGPTEISQLAEIISHFHDKAAVSPPDAPFGQAEEVFAPMQQNFDQLYPMITGPEAVAQLQRLEKWTQTRYQTLTPLLNQRKAAGFIRECHGDMHLGNMALIDGTVTIFDGIEFNDSFRWIDLMSEIAFLTMDLDSRNVSELSNHLLNAYLEQSGDYQGLQLLRFYQVYRALVRAKIATLRLTQDGLSDAERREVLAAYRSYTNLAEHYTQTPQQRLVITHGASGCGKTTVSQQAVEQFGFIRLRSDIERKRLFGLDPLQRSKSELNSGLYTQEATNSTYQQLLQLSALVLDSGFSPLVDATFLQQSQRAPFTALANKRQIALVILDIHADVSALRQRIAARDAKGNDASEANLDVLQQQLAESQPIDETEATQVIRIENRGENSIELPL